jgi:hypothetical protein
MSKATFINLNGATAAQICAHFDLDQEARSLLRDRMAPQSFVEALLANKQYIAGIDFMAHALRTREAIWWGCLCLQHACGSDLSAIDKAACKAAVQWVLEPNEGHRTAVSAPGQAAGHASAAGVLAQAVIQTRSNVAAPEAEPMPSEMFAPAKAVAHAIKLASVKSDPAKIADTQRRFADLGLGVAEGRFLWPETGNRPRVRRLE